jgi:hypothetical protein
MSAVLNVALRLQSGQRTVIVFAVADISETVGGPGRIVGEPITAPADRARASRVCGKRLEFSGMIATNRY